MEKRANFRALIEKNPSWTEKVTSRAKLKIVQLEPWLEPARLGLITNKYVGYNKFKRVLFYHLNIKEFEYKFGMKVLMWRKIVKYFDKKSGSFRFEVF